MVREMRRKVLSLSLLIFIGFLYIIPFGLGDNSKISGIDVEHDLKVFKWEDIKNIIPDLDLDDEDSEGSVASVNRLYNGLQTLYERNSSCIATPTQYATYKHADIANVTVINETAGNSTIVIQTYGDLRHAEKDQIFFIWCNCTSDNNSFYIVSFRAADEISEYWMYIAHRSGDSAADMIYGQNVYPNNTALELEFPSDWWNETNTGDDHELRVLSVTGEESGSILAIDFYPHNDPTFWDDNWLWIVLIMMIAMSGICYYIIIIKLKGKRL